MAGNRSKNLPSFRSVDELVAFFESHDMGDHWEQLPEAEVEVSLTRRKLGRTENAVRTKASEKGVSLKLKNQSSYYVKKK